MNEINFSTKLHQLQKLKIAIVHDYLAEYGGAERVVEEMANLFPQSDLFFGFVDKKKLNKKFSKFISHSIQMTFLSKIPFFTKLFSPLRFLAPKAFASLNLAQYDLVISSSNAYFAKAVKVKKGRHFCYCHTPARSLYGYNTLTDWKKNKLMLIYGSVLNHFLRLKDFEIAQNVDFFIANSICVKDRIAKFYRRSAKVIYPPVALVDKYGDLVTHCQSLNKKELGDYFLYVNRLAFAKHPELAIQVCLDLKLPLKVVGDGKLRSSLEKKYCSKLITFLGFVDDEHLAELYSQAKALIYPVEDEDFGIVPIEAMGFGLPVISYYSGGPKETIIDGQTGLFFHHLTLSSLKEALINFNKKKFSKDKIRQQAMNFNQHNFKVNFINFLYEKIFL